ncbi:MAG TPA: hypothetical protein PK728_11925 [Bacillota bacterium]|nr:hypothetical protein [Bacillota bacterium]
MTVRIKIEDHLIIPFGCPEWDAGKIKVAGLSAAALYLESKCPCVHIYRPAKRPLRLNCIGEVFPESIDSLILIDNPREALYYIRDCLKEKSSLQTGSGRRFLDLYFRKVDEQVTPGENERGRDPKDLPIPFNHYEWCFYAPMPLPQAYLGAPGERADGIANDPPRMFRVDFAFWTGNRPVAVDVGANTHLRSEESYRKERLLRNAGVWYVRITEEELSVRGVNALINLLPGDVNFFWDGLTMDDFFPSPIKLLIKLF